MELRNLLHAELGAAQELVFKPCKLACSSLRPEAESTDYGAYAFEINGMNIRFRAAKITPTKVGQFVTFWKRSGRGPIQPFDASDKIDLFIVAARLAFRFGLFIFPTSALIEQGIVSVKSVGGKRAIRVYPSWDTPTSKQAEKTQRWQLNYFLETPIELARAKMLLAGDGHIVAKR